MRVCCKSSWMALAIAMVAGASWLGYAIGRTSTQAPSVALNDLDPGLQLLRGIDASGSATGEEFSMATGLVSPEAEGVFVLDHTSGLLQCNVLYPRAGQFGAAFQCNVRDTLGGAGKNAKYLMVTGTAEFPGASNRPSANCVVYVLDQSTGAYGCFGIPFTKAMVNTGSPQMGALIPLSVGQARQALNRDDLR